MPDWLKYHDTIIASQPDHNPKNCKYCVSKGATKRFLTVLVLGIIFGLICVMESRGYLHARTHDFSSSSFIS